MKYFWSQKKYWFTAGLFVAFGAFFLMGNKEKNGPLFLEAERICITSPNQKERIEIGFFDQKAEIRFVSEKGKTTLSMSGGKEAKVQLNNEEGIPLASFFLPSQEEAQLQFNDGKKLSRLELKGGTTPAIYLRNEQETVVGSWSVFQEGGCGFGLAASNGAVSAILRGGDKPGLAFYDQSDLPEAVFGLLEKVPHLLVTGSNGEEGVLIHGGKSSGLMVIDENGQLKIFISKHGIYQGKEQKEMETPKEKQKLFSLEGDIKSLFPKKQKCR